MKKFILIFLISILAIITSCKNVKNQEVNHIQTFTKNTKVFDVISNESFIGFGNLIFPVDRSIRENMTLEEVGDIYIWYNYINPNKTVEIVNYMKEQVDSGKQIFYNIYTEEEMKSNPEKRNTGIFYFRGNPNSKFAIVNAGGGFVYVGAMQDSFPHALEISKNGYNAFALIYRPGWDTAMEDLARAIAFIHENAKELEVDVSNYSLWGGSAGGRMVAAVGTNGTASYGEKEYPKPAAAIIQYTGESTVTGEEPPTYSNVGTFDGIANYRTMENRINKIKQNGTDAEIEIFEGLPHGFGIGEGTIAEGWINNAIKFWERNMK